MRAQRTRVNYLGLMIATLAAFVASSLWYSPLLFGTSFIELSRFGADDITPNGYKIVAELGRTFLIAVAIARLLRIAGASETKGSLEIASWVWLGFPAMLLSGSVMWQQVPWMLAAIHAGDWLVKMLVITTIVSVWPTRARPATRVQ